MSTENVNQDQIDYWNSVAGHRWVQYEAALDSSMAPLGFAAMERARIRPGERVLDVGCGCGATTLALARAVGETGHVTAVDVSEPMVAYARARFATAPERNISSLLADASMHEFVPRVNLVFSRFGVMFFRDPARAFANLHRALEPGGRLAFVCWRPFAENEWARMPLEASLPHLPPMTPPGPEEPGPFSFARPERVHRILEGAGFSNVALEPFDARFLLGTTNVDESVNFSVETGPLSRALRDVDDATRARVREAVRAAYVPHEQNGHIALGAATWIVTATRDAK